MQHPKSDTGGPDGLGAGGRLNTRSARPACCRLWARSAVKHQASRVVLWLHARRLEPAASDADAGADAIARGRGPFLRREVQHKHTHSVNPDRLGNLDGQAGMPFRFLVPLLTRAGWFCAMTPRAPSCRSLRYAACGSALWARELLLWPPLGIFGGIP